MTVTNTQLGTTVAAHQPASGGNFFALNVPLQEGENTLVVEAQNTKGTLSTASLTVHTLEPQPLVRVVPTPAMSETLPAAVTLQIQTPLIGALSEVIIDRDGDGIIDLVQPFTPAVTVSYTTMGRFAPLVTLRTSDNLLFTNAPGNAAPVAILPPSVPDPVQAFLNVGTQVSDTWPIILTRASSLSWMPARGGAGARPHRDAGTDHYLTGGERTPGVGTRHRRQFVYCRYGQPSHSEAFGRQRVRSGHCHRPGWAFGTHGQGEGQFDSPEDVGMRPVGTADAIFVADTGNHRIQRFSVLGQFELAFDGGAAPTGPIVAPRGLIGYSSSNGVRVIDSGQSRVCLFARDGTSGSCLGTGGTAAGEFQNPAKLARAPIGGVAVADTDNHRIQLFGPEGLQRIVSLPVAPRAGVDDSTDKGDRLLVAPVTGSTILVIPLTMDPPDATPLAVVQAYLDALSAQDMMTARALVVSYKQAEFDALMQDPQFRNQAFQNAPNVHDLVVYGMGSGGCGVSGLLIQQGQTQNVGFTLVRNRATGIWKLDIF